MAILPIVYGVWSSRSTAQASATLSVSAAALSAVIYMILLSTPGMLCAYHAQCCICLLVHDSPWPEYLRDKDCLPFNLIPPGSGAKSWYSMGKWRKRPRGTVIRSCYRRLVTADMALILKTSQCASWLCREGWSTKSS